MKSFRFNLQALLTLRQREEHTALEHYAQSLLARQRAIEDLGVISRELDTLRLRASTELENGCRAEDLMRSHLHCQRLDGERNRCELVVAGAGRATDLALRQLLTARQAREVVEKHRDHQRATHDRTLNRAEQRFLDDLVTRRGAPGLIWQTNREN